MVRLEHDGRDEKAAHDARMDTRTRGVVRMITIQSSGREWRLFGQLSGLNFLVYEEGNRTLSHDGC